MFAVNVSQFIKPMLFLLLFMKFEITATGFFSNFHESRQKQHAVYKQRHLNKLPSNHFLKDP